MLIKDLPIDEQIIYCAWHNFNKYDTVEHANEILGETDYTDKDIAEIYGY